MSVFTLVTVAHEVDWALMKLQARSLDRYLPKDATVRIHVVENFTPGFTGDWRTSLYKAYRGLADKVVFHRAADLAQMPAGADGWWTQQVLKLAIAKRLSGEFYTVLDAKNHLVFPLHEGFLRGADGRARLRRYSYEAHPLRDKLTHTLSYLGIDPTPALTSFAQTSTPFTLYRPAVNALIDYVVDREKLPFARAFLDRKLTEFFLYSGWLQKQGDPGRLYAYDQPECPIIWSHQVAPLDVLRIIGHSERSGEAAPFFSVHRATIKRLDAVGREAVAQYWLRRELFGSMIDAHRALDELRA